MNLSLVLIVDDEPLARKRLQRALGQMDDLIGKIDVADGCVSALRSITRNRPDIVLLDISMRDGSGLDLLEQITSADEAPAIIFATAFQEFAARAFELNAVDYLLKPISFERLRGAILRARNTMSAREASEQLAELQLVIAALRQERPPPEHRQETDFWIRRGTGGYVRVPASAIEWISVEDDYVRLHVDGRSHLLRESIKGILSRLDGEKFVQVHRSSLVQVAFVQRIDRSPDGRPEVVLTTGHRLPVGRIYAMKLRRRFF